MSIISTHSRLLKFAKQIAMCSGILATLGLMLTIRTSAQQSKDFIDRDTQYRQMHICADAAFMEGVHVGRNEFVCTSHTLFSYTDLRDIRISGYDMSRTQFTFSNGKQIHICPRGEAMRGLHVSNNWLACAPTTLINSTYELGNIFVDYNTQRDGRHVCDKGGIMIGIHVNDNILVCREIRRR